MNAYIPLLLACLLTIPAVTAEAVGTGPAVCDLETGEGSCTVGANSDAGNGPQELKDDCPELKLGYNTHNRPPTVHPDPRIECIIPP